MEKFNLLCWSCNKEYDSADVPFNPTDKDQSHKCECGGYVVSPSGKTKIKLVEPISNIVKEE
jgi:hypothetical protein